jgi:DNA-directed RNA polymerase specialized sigma24 family protein
MADLKHKGRCPWDDDVPCDYEIDSEIREAIQTLSASSRWQARRMLGDPDEAPGLLFLAAAEASKYIKRRESQGIAVQNKCGLLHSIYHAILCKELDKRVKTQREVDIGEENLEQIPGTDWEQETNSKILSQEVVRRCGIGWLKICALRFDQNCTWSESARFMNMSEQGVRRLYYEGLKRIRTIIDPKRHPPRKGPGSKDG